VIALQETKVAEGDLPQALLQLGLVDVYRKFPQPDKNFSGWG